ncbi:MAG: hypothetical protein OEW08_11485 [Gammaproteobacteria bacterium]|nr:hypothetical protein [Gammaproteobacteria bacterium]
MTTLHTFTDNIHGSPRGVGIALLCLLSMFTNAARADDAPSKSKEKIPLLISVGAGYGDYELRDAYTGKNALIHGIPIAISGVIEQETVKKYQDKIPKKFRKAATSFSEISMSHAAIPDVLYVHPYDGEKEAYGGTWGMGMTFGTGFSFLKFGVTGAVVGTYLYYHDVNLRQSVHFIRPGVRGKINLEMPVFTKYLLLEAGYSKDLYWGQTFFGNHKMDMITGAYGMLHVRVPFSIEAAI